MTILDRAIHFRTVIDLRSLIIFFLGLMNQIMFFFTICSFDGHADIAHINFNVAVCTLNQYIMLRIVERRTVFHDSIGTVSKFQQEEQHIVLVAKLLALMRNIAASHGNLCCRSHQELDAVQLVDMVIKVTTGFCADLLPTDGRLRLFPAVSCRVAIENTADFPLRDQTLCMAYRAEEVHDMACHEDHTVFFAGAYHFVAVRIAKRDRLFTEDVLLMTCCCQNRLFVQIVRRSYQHSVDIITRAELIQIRFDIAAKLFCHSLSIFGVINCNNFCPLLLFHNATKFSTEIPRTDNCISNRFHNNISFYLIEPCAKPPAMRFWISMKKITEGITTSADAAIITPQSSTS